jgi:hypothetical protein
MFVVRNWDNGNYSNPTGLIYETTVTYDSPPPTVTPTPTPTVTPVTVGGTVLKINKIQVLAPWIGSLLGLAALLSLAARRYFSRRKI